MVVLVRADLVEFLPPFNLCYSKFLVKRIPTNFGKIEQGLASSCSTVMLMVVRCWLKLTTHDYCCTRKFSLLQRKPLEVSAQILLISIFLLLPTVMSVESSYSSSSTTQA